MGNKKVKKIILFASGSGTNVENIIKYFHDNIHVEIVAVFTNNPKAGVIDRVEQMKIPLNIFNKLELNNGELVKQICLLTPDLIVLAGFLLKIPLDFTKIFSKKSLTFIPHYFPNMVGKGCMVTGFTNRSKKLGIKKPGSAFTM